MSLSKHLRDANSPVRMYLDRVSPVLADTRGNTSEAKARAAALGLQEFANSDLIVPAGQGIDASRIGTAFDIRTRIALDGFDMQTSSAAVGVQQLHRIAKQIPNGTHRARVLSDALDIAKSRLNNPSSDGDLNIASLILACGEQIYRAGPPVLSSVLGSQLDSAKHGQQFVDSISAADIRDLDELLTANLEQINTWKDEIQGGVRFEANIAFAGSSLVGGADADWLLGSTLIDCKVYGSLTVPKIRDFLRQLLGYVLLDLDDALQIREVGIWLPRQARLQTWSLRKLFGSDPERLLPKLRDGFIKATRHDQLGIYQPLTQLKKDELLAENTQTPIRMLEALATRDEQRIRLRVARNIATPERTIRRLAKDRYARVREGVAMNVSTPADIIETFHHDKSVVVRRAAGENPGSLRSQVSALAPSETNGINSDSSARADSSLQKSARDVTGEHHEIVQYQTEREEWVSDSRWILIFLRKILGEGTSLDDRYLFPHASRMWAAETGRHLEIPEQLTDKLPYEVLADLFREDRPSQVRQIIASRLPIEDQAVRERLLHDIDPDIRWSILKRSIDYPTRSMAAFLAKLADSRLERIRFRTAGDGQTDRTRAQTQTELDHQTLSAIAAHPSAPPTTLRGLIETKVPVVLTSLAKNRSLSEEDRGLLVPAMLAIRATHARCVFAASSSTPPEALRQLARSRVSELRITVAANPSTPVETLLQLASDPDFEVRINVLRNPRTPTASVSVLAEKLLANSMDEELAEVLNFMRQREDISLSVEVIEEALDRLSKSRLRNPDLRLCVTSHDLTGPETLERLARSTDERLRKGVALHARTPANVLSRLAHDADSEVRAAVARNPMTDSTTLVELIKDQELQVRRHSARNPSLDRTVLERLLADVDHHLRDDLLMNSSLETDDVRRLTASKDDRAKSHRTPAQLHEMAASSRVQTRMYVAYSKDATPDVLRFLVGRGRSVQIRRVVAAHPHTSVDVLWTLAKDKDVEVRQAVALNANAPASLLMHLAGISIDLALLVTLNPDVPDEVLKALSHDHEALVQFVATSRLSGRSLGRASKRNDLSDGEQYLRERALE